MDRLKAALAPRTYRVAFRRRLWFVLALALGVSVPVPAEAVPGIDLSEEVVHGWSVRVRARPVRGAAFAARAVSLTHVGSVQLSSRTLLERFPRQRRCTSVRKVPARACDSSVPTPDH